MFIEDSELAARLAEGDSLLALIAGVRRVAQPGRPDDRDVPPPHAMTPTVAASLGESSLGDAASVLIKERHPKRGSHKTTEERIQIGVASRVLGPTLAGELLGMSPQAASFYGAGNVNQTDAAGDQQTVARNRAEVDARVGAKKSAILDIVLDKVLDGVNQVDAQDMDSKKTGRRVATVAKLATVIDRVEGRNVNKGSQPAFQLIVHAPQIRAESAFSVIDVSG